MKEKPYKYSIGDEYTYTKYKYTECECCGSEISEEVTKTSFIVKRERVDPSTVYVAQNFSETSETSTDENGNTVYKPYVNTITVNDTYHNQYTLEDGYTFIEN